MKYNKPYGIQDSELSPQVKKLLSLGSGFSAKITTLKESLGTVLESAINNWNKKSIDYSNCIEFFRQLINSIPTTEPTDPLQRTINSAIKTIKFNKWIVKQADKNLDLVLMHHTVYNSLLSKDMDDDSFEEVKTFPRNALLSQLKHVLNYCNAPPKIFKNIMDEATKHPDPSPLYVVPKIHKSTLKSRPITAQHSYIFTSLSKQLGKILYEEVLKIPAISINSKQTIRQLESRRLPNDCVLLTYDVERCYPSIDISDSLITLRKNYPAIFLPNNGFWLRILEMIMRNNYVTANGKIYRQLNGTATGSAVAPTFADLYQHCKFKPAFRKHYRTILFNKRYVDDGLVIMRTKEAAQQLLIDLNLTSNLKITGEISNTEAIYLDIKFYKGTRFSTNNILDSVVYTKPTSKFLYLHGSSNHPRHVFEGIIKGLSLIHI